MIILTCMREQMNTGVSFTRPWMHKSKIIFGRAESLLDSTTCVEVIRIALCG